tara:strand:- start:402 stop:1322 length:921 start_codon:yes stop_codon:yes gene_type:complete
MKQIKTKGMTIKVPKGNAFPYKTPTMCPKAHILCGVFGKRGASKSTSTVNLISEMGYDRAFVISPTFASNYGLMKMLPIEDESDIYTDVDDVSCIDEIVGKMDKIRDDMLQFEKENKQYKTFLKVLNDPTQNVSDSLLLMFYGNGNFEPPKWKYGLDANGKPKPPMCALLVDDAQGSKLMTNRKTQNAVLRHRHLGAFPGERPSIGLSMFFLCQTYRSMGGGCPKYLRANQTCSILFKNKDLKEIDFVASELAGEVSKDEFLKAYEFATEEPYGFLFVDLHKKDCHPSGLRKNLNTFLIPGEYPAK